MTDQSRLDKLQSTAFFKEFPSRQLAELVDEFREVDLRAGSTVFKEYDRAKDVYVILSGEIGLAICDAKILATNRRPSAGDLMGWSPLVGRARLYDTARAICDVKALAIDGEKLMKFCAANPEFGFRFMHRVAGVLAERLSGTRQQLLEMGGVHLPKFQLESD